MIIPINPSKESLVMSWGHAMSLSAPRLPSFLIYLLLTWCLIKTEMRIHHMNVVKQPVRLASGLKLLLRNLGSLHRKKELILLWQSYVSKARGQRSKGVQVRLAMVQFPNLPNPVQT